MLYVVQAVYKMLLGKLVEDQLTSHVILKRAKLKKCLFKSFWFSVDAESRSHSDCSHQRLRVVHVDGVVQQVSLPCPVLTRSGTIELSGTEFVLVKVSEKQSISVITNSSGPSIFVRCNRVNLCTKVTNLTSKTIRFIVLTECSLTTEFVITYSLYSKNHLAFRLRNGIRKI